MNGPALWGQRPDEGPKPFAAFQTYRDQPPMERSLRKLASLLGRSIQLISDWSSKYRWVERVKAWDQEQERLLQAQVAAERLAFAKRLAAVGTMMQTKGYGKIRTYVDRIDKDGFEVELQPGQRYIDEMSVAEATRLIETGAKLEAMGRGLPPEPEAAPTELTIVPNPVVEALTHDPSKIAEAVDKMEELAELLGWDEPTIEH